MNVVIPDTNAKGWPMRVLIDPALKQIMRHEYKTDEEVDEDNNRLAKGTLGWKWILNDPSKAK